MKAFDINLGILENVRRFVAIARCYPFDISLEQGERQVDGKSLLGILCFDLNRPVRMIAHTDSCPALEAELASFIAA